MRHSLVDPYAYVQANVMGHLVILEAARRIERLRHLVYASSSSVYGANQALPFAETDRVDTPVSLYAATKRADELMSHAYGHLFGLPQTGLRFFTVYGPWGRPDMAYYSFARAIVAGEPITLYDGGPAAGFHLHRRHRRRRAGRAGPSAGRAPRRRGVLNIGNHRSESVSDADRRAGAGAGSDRRGALGAATADRRDGDLRRDRGDRRADRVRADDHAGGGHSAVRRLVPRLARAERLTVSPSRRWG